ncbi:hypothetical protein GCM10009547_24940 [Sporichthya brevicatena]|uniref:Tetratricopeptide repeat protein n=1 Tax=Sporichthya brevicatena TaxID=171442 RepID=A0ABP3RYV9_9ACTN
MPAGPAVAPDVTGEELDKAVVRELSTLRAEAAESAAKHLVMVARLLDEEPDLAYAHAEAARKHGPRVAVIREAFGIAAYRCEKYAEALAELRAARRISGDQEHWPMMADCERALGRPEKALQMAAAPEVAKLSKAGKVEMRIVAAGARSDLGQLEAAVVTLQSPELTDPRPSDWSARLKFAYAAALEAVGREDEARVWYGRAAAADPDGLTDAAERLAELDGIVFLPDEEGAEFAAEVGDAEVGDAEPVVVDVEVELEVVGEAPVGQPEPEPEPLAATPEPEPEPEPVAVVEEPPAPAQVEVEEPPAADAEFSQIALFFSDDGGGSRWEGV